MGCGSNAGRRTHYPKFPIRMPPGQLSGGARCGARGLLREAGRELVRNVA